MRVALLNLFPSVLGMNRKKKEQKISFPILCWSNEQSQASRESRERCSVSSFVEHATFGWSTIASHMWLNFVGKVKTKSALSRALNGNMHSVKRFYLFNVVNTKYMRVYLDPGSTRAPRRSSTCLAAASSSRNDFLHSLTVPCTFSSAESKDVAMSNDSLSNSAAKR